MNEFIGKVVDVFIPKQLKNGHLLDNLDSNQVGFKIETSDGIKEVVVEQNSKNAQIMKGDFLIVLEQEIDNKSFIDIEVYDGDSNE